jgi:hypothetical protein
MASSLHVSPHSGTSRSGLAAAGSDPSPLKSSVIEHLSLSRLRRRAQCARQDWWYTEGARDGYRRDASTDARTAYALKKLTSMPAVVGIVVHEAAAARARAVRDGRRPPTVDELWTRVRAKLNEAATSRDIDGFLRDPANTIMCREVFLEEWPNGRIPASIAEATGRQVRRLLSRMVEHPVWAELAGCSREDLLICDSLDALERTEQGIPIRLYAAPDLVWISREPMQVPGFGVPLIPPILVITDWKTGLGRARVEEAREQLCCYAWFATQKLRLDPIPRAVVARVADLGANDAESADVQWVLGPNDLARGERRFLDAVAEIASERGNSGVVPMSRTTRSLTACRWCPFTTLCFSDANAPLGYAAAPHELW